MGIGELFILAVSLSMDAFAVSVCKGLSLGRISVKHMATAGLWFGSFQALMPLLGYFLGKTIADIVSKYAHWTAFFLLVFIGGNMLRETLWGDEEQEDSAMDVKTMLLLAIATSIDAFAVGVMFAFLQVSILPAVSFIGLTTFVISAAGVKIGSVFGLKYKKKAQICGGAVLILLGVKILLDGLGIL